MLAMNWAYVKRDEYHICLFTHHHNVNMAGVETCAVDLEDEGSIRRNLVKLEPGLVVHTVGMTNVDKCELNPGLAKVTNVDIARNIAKVTGEMGIKLVHISTDHLFSGKKPLVDEGEAPAPLNVYATTKLEAEREVMKHHPGALIVRTNFYGCGHRDRISFTDWIYTSLTSSKKITMFDDVYYTPALIDNLVNSCHEVVNVGNSGILNIVGDERISKYTFAKIFAKVFGLDSSLIIKGSINDCKVDAERPKDMSLSNKKVTEIIMHGIGTVEEGLNNLLAQKQNNRDIEINRAYLG